MALPPILTNLPFVKLFRTEQPAAGPAGEKAAAAKGGAGAPKDIVEISEAALKKLEDESQFLSDKEAQGAAAETRDILEKNPEVSLGLAADFS